MFRLLKYLAVGVVGTLLGLFLTYVTVEREIAFGAVEAGPWTARPQVGTTDIDPYARAILALSGELPLGAAEGLRFVARRDSSGRKLDPACDYLVAGNMPRARYWTLTLRSADGRLVANPAERYGFTSTEILRSSDGRFVIVLSRHARSGNWLPIGGDARFILDLRLYDGEVDTGSTPLPAADFPEIVRGPCR